MNAKEAREIKSDGEHYDRQTDEWFMAKGYLAALEGEEVKGFKELIKELVVLVKNHETISRIDPFQEERDERKWESVANKLLSKAAEMGFK
jgi:hypothetical protein